MKVTYIHHSCFLVETGRFYYLFDYYKGSLPEMNKKKPIFVLSSHGHSDHYNPRIFSVLKELGMEKIAAILSDDIKAPEDIAVLSVSPGKEYDIGSSQKLTTFRSTDMGVAFLIEDEDKLIYHSGDLNDWVWDEESDSYNAKMTEDYRGEIMLLSKKLCGRELDLSFVVLDPRQEKDYMRGLLFFLENIPVKKVYPMHYWENPSVIGTFLSEYPEYASKIEKTE